jgi:hypothetical protein
MLKAVMFSITFALMSSLAPAISLAGEKVEMKFAYLPESSYVIEQSTQCDMTMKLQNPFAAPEQLRKKFPMVLDVRDRRTISIVTGAVIDNDLFPITFELKKGDQIASINGGFPQKIGTGLEKLLGIRAYGTADKNGNLKLAKVEGKAVSQEDKRIIATVFEQIAKAQSQMESKPVAVGESFTQKIPITIPVPGIASVGMENEIVYTLVRVENRLAEFDTISSFKLAMSADSKPVPKIEMTGDGSGKLVYNMDKRVASKVVNKFNVEMAIPMEGAMITVTSKFTDTATTEVQ